jgi:hypothetical protein
VDVGGVVEGVDLVLGREALGDDLELQHADGAEQQVVVDDGLEHLDGAFLAQLLQALLQLLGLEAGRAGGRRGTVPARSTGCP